MIGFKATTLTQYGTIPPGQEVRVTTFNDEIQVVRWNGKGDTVSGPNRKVSADLAGIGEHRGFGIGSAAAGALLLGPVGLAAGLRRKKAAPQYVISTSHGSFVPAPGSTEKAMQKLSIG